VLYYDVYSLNISFSNCNLTVDFTVNSHAFNSYVLRCISEYDVETLYAYLVVVGRSRFSTFLSRS